MSVKRYTVNAASVAELYDLLPGVVVSAHDYDALAAMLKQQDGELNQAADELAEKQASIRALEAERDDVVEARGEMVKENVRLATELAGAKSELAIAEANRECSSRALNDRIRALEADLADSRLIAREQEDAHVAANMRYSAELALRQTAEGYAARNALRVIEVEAELAEFKKHIPLKGGVPLRQYVLETALREISKDNFLYKSTQIAIKALNPPQTETACTCDSTLVTDTSNHQPHCPRSTALETKGEQG